MQMEVLSIDNLTAFMLVFIRMGGMIFLNPLFARRNVPARVRVGLALCLTFLLAPMQNVSAIEAMGNFDLILAMIREFLMGVVCAYVFQFFYFLIFFVGDIIDMQMGLSMAKVFDPGTSIQMSVTGNFLSLLFMLYFFATDSHLILIRLFASSYQIVPIGAFGITENMATFMLDLFVSAFSLAFRLALPFVMAELIVEVSMGILMKLIPQIHVFVINIQFKLLLGFIMLLLFAQPIGNFTDHYITSMLQSIQKAMMVLGG